MVLSVPRRTQMAPTGPKLAPGRPEMASEHPKEPPRRLVRAPRGPPKGPNKQKSSQYFRKTDIFSIFAGVVFKASKTVPEVSKIAPRRAK